MKSIIRICLAAMFLALGLVLPFLTGQIPAIGNMLSPMHLPVLLCGLICGPLYGGIVGFILPLLRYALFSMPPIIPTGIPMAFELLTYGVVIGFIYEKFKKNTLFSVLVSLIIAMLLGRVVGGVVMTVVMGVRGNPYGLSAFFTAYFVNAIPGIIIQLILIPAVMQSIKKLKK